MTAQAGTRASLAAILLEGLAGMPGCLSYVVAEDPADPDALWITEAWESQGAYRASLSLPSVQAAIARGAPPDRRHGNPSRDEADRRPLPNVAARGGARLRPPQI
jgi:quinol monooxygenase YgiN